MNTRKATTAKAAPFRGFNEEATQEADHKPGFTMETEVVYREKGHIPFGSGTSTIGDMLDQQIKSLADNDGEMRSFSISFSEEDWKATKEVYKGYEPPYRPG